MSKALDITKWPAAKMRSAEYLGADGTFASWLFPAAAEPDGVAGLEKGDNVLLLGYQCLHGCSRPSDLWLVVKAKRLATGWSLKFRHLGPPDPSGRAPRIRRKRS